MINRRLIPQVQSRELDSDIDRYLSDDLEPYELLVEPSQPTKRPSRLRQLFSLKKKPAFTENNITPSQRCGHHNLDPPQMSVADPGSQWTNEQDVMGRDFVDRMIPSETPVGNKLSPIRTAGSVRRRQEDQDRFQCSRGGDEYLRQDLVLINTNSSPRNRPTRDSAWSSCSSTKPKKPRRHPTTAKPSSGNHAAASRPSTRKLPSSATPVNIIDSCRPPVVLQPRPKDEVDLIQINVLDQSPNRHPVRISPPADHPVRPSEQDPHQPSRDPAPKTTHVVQPAPSEEAQLPWPPYSVTPASKPAVVVVQPTRPYPLNPSPPPVVSPRLSSSYQTTNSSLFDSARSSTLPTSIESEEYELKPGPTLPQERPISFQTLTTAPVPNITPTFSAPASSCPGRLREQHPARTPPTFIPPPVYDPIPTIAQLEEGVGFESSSKAIVAVLRELTDEERHRTALAKQQLSYDRAWTQEIRSQTAELKEMLAQISRRRGKAYCSPYAP